MAYKPSSPNDHTVKSYDDELAHLTGLVARMGALAEAQLGAALEALARRDDTLASRVIAGDAEIDALEHEVYAFTVRLLALRQPMAQDLRSIVGALKMSGDLERMADYAANLAKRVRVLDTLPPLASAEELVKLGQRVRPMILAVMDAYVRRDIEAAKQVRDRDSVIDEEYTAVVRRLIAEMMADPKTVTAGTQLMFMAKNVERIGDHATNIAEMIYYLVHGTTLAEERTKADRTTEPFTQDQS